MNGIICAVCCDRFITIYFKPVSLQLANKCIKPVCECQEGSMDNEVLISLCRDVPPEKGQEINLCLLGDLNRDFWTALKARR